MEYSILFSLSFTAKTWLSFEASKANRSLRDELNASSEEFQSGMSLELPTPKILNTLSCHGYRLLSTTAVQDGRKYSPSRLIYVFAKDVDVNASNAR